jgi:uncharacterized protein (DUF2141 family)
MNTRYSIIAAFLATAGIALSASAATLTVKITEISEVAGKMGVRLVASGEAYSGKAKATAAQMVPVTSKDPITLTFADLAPGTYAVLVMHDENGNGKLDSNMLGIPKEGYGFSNNPHVMRQPTWDETKFELTAVDQAIEIEIL